MLTAVGTRIIVEVEEKVQETAGGVVLPGIVDVGENKRATVLSVGNKVSIGVEEGDDVLYNKFGGIPVKHEDKEYLVLQETEIVAAVQTRQF